jgi:uncharacterized protein
VSRLRILVVLALPDITHSVELWLSEGSTVEDAVARSGLAEHHPGINVSGLARGIWGKIVGPSTELAAGDRVELYRPLLADAKRDRRRRARRR